MKHINGLLARLVGLATSIVGLVVFTASRAAAMQPDPGPGNAGTVHDGSGTPSVLRVSDNSVSVLQWVLFVAVVIGALVLGAALTHLAQRRRLQPAR